MISEKLLPYSHMWTTDKHLYGLVEMDPRVPNECLVMELASGVHTIDEAPEVVDEIVNSMREAGVRILSLEEARNLHKSR